MTTSTDLWATIAAGDLEQVLGLLHENPALAAARNEQGVSAVITAMYHRRPDLAEVFAAAGAPLDFMEMIALGRLQGVTAALQSGASVTQRSPDGFAPAHYAAFFDRPEIMAVLLDHGAEVSAVADNPMKVQPLHSAVAARSVGCVRQLLQAGAPVNATQEHGWTALQAAAKHGDVELIVLLLEHGADAARAADNGQTALDMAAAGGHEDAVQLMRAKMQG